MANMHQLYAACVMYAGDFNDWYPVWGGYDSSHPINQIKGEHYTRYVFGPDTTVNAPVPLGFVHNGHYSDENLGYLYGGGFLGDGKIMWCPSFSNATGKTNLLSIEAYSNPSFMSTDGSGNVRSTYMFNPRMTEVTPTTANVLRRYQKTSDARALDVFMTDYMSSSSETTSGVKFDAQNWPHWPSKGMMACFTDGSANYTRLAPTIFTAITSVLITAETQQSYLQYNTILNALQNSQ